MNSRSRATIDQDTLAENFAAELTEVAYPIALRHGGGENWLDLELNLWHEFAATVKDRGRDPRRPWAPRK